MSEETNDTQSGVADGVSDVSTSPTPTQDTAAVSGTQSSPSASATATEEKLFAGKYKSAEELEKGYIESQKLIGDTDLRKKAELVDELASLSGVSVEQLREQLNAEKTAKEAEAAGFTPEQYNALKAMQNSEVDKLRLDLKMTQANQELDKLAAQSPIVASQREVLKNLSIQTGKPVTALFNELYAPVIAAAEAQAATKLSEKEAANALSPNGDADTVVNAQDLQALKDRASRSKSPNDIAAYMTAKKRAK